MSRIDTERDTFKRRDSPFDKLVMMRAPSLLGCFALAAITLESVACLFYECRPFIGVISSASSTRRTITREPIYSRAVVHEAPFVVPLGDEQSRAHELRNSLLRQVPQRRSYIRSRIPATHK